MSRTIRSSAGGKRYLTATITETTGKDITGDTYVVSLGSYTAPGTWTAATPTTVTTSQVKVAVLVGSGGTLDPTAGDYWLWVKVADNPEVEPIRIDERITIA